MIVSLLVFMAAVVTSSKSSEVESSQFLVPALYSYGQCGEVPYPQTLHIYLTTQMEDAESKALLIATGKSSVGVFWALQRDNTIRNVFDYSLLQLHNEVENFLFCLNTYCYEKPTEAILNISNGVCSERDATSGLYSFIGQDLTVSFIVSNKGPNFMHIYAALPFDDRQNVTYYVLNPTQYQDDYIQGFAIRALKKSTTITIFPTSMVRIFRPSQSTITSFVVSLDIVTVEAYDEVTLILRALENVWVEAVTETCNSQVTLTGTRIESAHEVAVHSIQALCNKTMDSGLNETVSSVDELNSLPFSTIVNPLRQLPPVYKWGTLFFSDLAKLRSFSEAEMKYFVLSFSIIAANESQVSIKCHAPKVLLCHAVQSMREGEVWQYQLQIQSMLQADAIAIRGTGPIMVLHEIYTQGRQQVYHSELVQPVQWFTIQQAVPILYSFGPQPQRFFVTLTVPDNSVKTEHILIWDNKDSEQKMALDEYRLIKTQSSSSVENHTLFHLEIDPLGYDGKDFVMQFVINNTELEDGVTKFGASAFSYNGYAFSHGYILDDNVTDNCEQEALSDNPYPFSAAVGGSIAGTVGVLLVIILIAISLMLYHKKVMPLLPWLPQPPSEGFEYDVFISFADEDRDFACKILHEPLTQRDYSILLHLTDFIAGMTIEDNIVRAVNISRVVIFVCSKAFEKSSFCQTELKYAMESHYGKFQGRYRRVIPVVIEGECPVEMNTFRLRPIKVSGNAWDYSQKDIAQFVKALNLGKPVQILGENSTSDDGSQV